MIISNKEKLEHNNTQFAFFKVMRIYTSIPSSSILYGNNSVDRTYFLTIQGTANSRLLESLLKKITKD